MQEKVLSNLYLIFARCPFDKGSMTTGTSGCPEIFKPIRLSASMLASFSGKEGCGGRLSGYPCKNPGSVMTPAGRMTSGFCRNCLSRWFREEAQKKGIKISDPDARKHVYGMSYEEWKEKYQK